ncbi:MAG: hypothetical protein U0V03_04265 [Bacteroidia bacterium]
MCIFIASFMLLLRLKTLLGILLPKAKFVKISLVLLCLLFSVKLSAQASIEETKKTANKYFEDEEYDLAYKLYSQLVSNFPKDAELNFKLGVCMIYSEPDKKKCLPYLQIANASPDAPKETKFYIGKANHINYLFDEAIKYYNEYKKIGSNSQQKKLKVDREIAACGYGKRLLSNLSDLTVTSKKQLNEADYFRTYDLKSIGGKLLAKPDDFKTTPDKRKKDKSVVYLDKNSNKVYYSSYGDNTETGRDIYYSVKQGNGTYSKGVKLSTINTEYDEDFPFLHPNGRVLYFASKGHNSMGGYDIFKSEYNAENDTWGPPVNLEFPINSPDDDYLFVTDSLEKTAYFSTGRQSPPGKIDVLKINTERKPIETLVIKGTVVKENKEQSLLSKITVKNMDNGQIVGEYKSGDNGDYLLDLPNGAKLIFTVETPELKTQSQGINLPLVQSSKPLKQKISYEKGELKIINYFDEAPTDDSYVQYLKLIEEKAKLNVNEGKNKLTLNNVDNNISANNTTSNNNITSAETNTNQSTATSTSNTANSSNTNTTQTKSDNKQLSSLAKKEAEDSKNEAVQFSKDANDAFDLANAKMIESDNKLKEYDEALKNANSISNEDDKNKALANAKLIKDESDALKDASNKIKEYSNLLNEDAKTKAKEAELNLLYSNELDKIATGKSIDPKNSLKNLNEYEVELNKLSNNKTKSTEFYNTLKNETEEKEKQLVSLEETTNAIKENLKEIESEIKTSEEELAKAKKKNKQEIQQRIDELKEDTNGKKNQIKENETKIALLKVELAADKNPLALANKVNTETISNKEPIKINTPITNTNTAIANNTNVVKADNLLLNYKDKTEIKDPNNKICINESTAQLKNFNKEIDQSIAKNKTELTKVKTTEDKSAITTEIKNLENLKKLNNQKIIENNKLALALNNTTNNTNTLSTNNPSNITNSTAIANNSNSITVLSKINTNNNTDALNQLTNLSNSLNSYNNQNFNFNSYQNESAQKLKIEADEKINEANTKQKALNELIKTTVSEFKNTTNNSNSTNNSNNNSTINSYNKLSKEAEDLNNQALDKMEKANAASGEEKDKLRNEANDLTTKANEKSLEAALVLKSDNEFKFNANKKNVETLLNSSSTNETDKNFANALLNQAIIDYNKAKAMREEAMSLPNAIAKVSALGNAEEKENEAIQKLSNAVETLKKSNPNAVLVSTNPNETNTQTENLTTTTANNTLNENSTEKINTINKGVDELQQSKLTAYQKLQEANQAEINQLLNELQNNTAVSNIPANKTEFINATSKNNKANNLFEQNKNESNVNTQLNNLINITTNQIEVINQLNKLKNKTNSIAQNNTNTTTNINNNSNNTTNSSNNQTNTSNNNTTNSNNNQTNTLTNTTNNNTNLNTTNNTTSTNTKSATSNNSNINVPIIDKNSISTKDSSTKGTTEYINSNKFTIQNQQAKSTIDNALNELTSLNNNNSSSKTITPSELKTQIDEINAKADELALKSFDLKTEANNQTGEEKDKTLAKSKQFDEESNTEKLKALDLTKQLNQSNINSNNYTIEDLISKLKTDNPTLANENDAKLNELKTLQNQIIELQKEANDSNAIAVKIGKMTNVADKEAELIAKQNTIISELIKNYPNYEIKTNNISLNNSKSNIEENNDENITKQNSALTNLINGYSLEYETSKTSLPQNLNDNQLKAKQNADSLNTEAKSLLIKSSQISDIKQKNKILAQAAKTNNAALKQLSLITINTNNIASNNTNNTKSNNNSTTNVVNNNNSTTTKTNTNNNTSTNNNVVKNSNNNQNQTKNNSNNNSTNTNNVNNTSTNNQTRTTLKVEGLEVINGNAYNNNRPIPMNAKIPDGLVFRVQIGAFKNALPNNAFRGLNPLNGETVTNGYIRYTAGNFNKFENASAVKNDLKKLGYNDAFVVVYYNGKRIALNEALAILEREGKTIDNNASSTAGITANTNIPKASVVFPNSPNTAPTPPNELVKVTKEIETIKNLFYTVQIGVYSKQVTKTQLANLSPIYTEKLTNGLYRYTAGIYNNGDKVIVDKRRVIEIGIKDAFVSSYLNGKRVDFNDYKNRQKTDSTIVMESENPIVFPEGSPIANTNTTIAIPTLTIEPFKNNITNYPEATEDNGVKATQDGVCFKVQIGAYSKQVPNEVAAKFSSIQNWPIENKQINALYIYNVGNFVNAKNAVKLRDEVIKLGILDAFITIYKDGNKVYNKEEIQKLMSE